MISLSRRRALLRWTSTIAVASGLGGAAVIGCSGDDSTGGGPTDASITIDVTIVPSDSGNPKDATVIVDTGTDAAIVCTSAPDAAMYSADDIDAGQQIVTTKGCRGCHTADLSGNTVPVGIAYPKNLTPDVDSGLGCWTDDQIANAFLNGIDDEGEHLCVMPKFAGSIDDAGAAELVAYLRSIPAVSKVIPETTCPSLDAGIDAD